jgi:hypothetical protein
MGLWTNSDGLRVKLGNTEAEVGRGGELNKGGTFREWEFVVDLTDATDASALVPDTDNIIFPIGFVLSEVEVINETAATSGGSATLNLGLARANDYSTAYDADGFLAVAPLADYNAVGEHKTYRVGVTGIGALAGVATATYPTVLVWDYETAAFTAGRLKIVVRGYIKRPSASH